MDTSEETGLNTKIPDSVYSNSCSNSQSRSHRSHSGSNSSGSSGYGGKPSTSGSSSDNLVQTSKKDKKDTKKKKQSLSQTEAKAEDSLLDCLLEGIPPESVPLSGVIKELTRDVFETATRPLAQPENAVVNMTVLSSGLSSKNDKIKIEPIKTNVSIETSCEVGNSDRDGFSCAISMIDGVVMYITRSVITKLGFPKNLWIGRSFVDFIHPKDHSTFGSQITRALAIPAVKGKQFKSTFHYFTESHPFHVSAIKPITSMLNHFSSLGVISTVQSSEMSDCAMVCRMRRYRSLNSGFGVKNQDVAYLPFVLNFSFNKQDGKISYLIITATSVYSAFKTRNELLANATPFTMRQSATGFVDYIDIASVPYLGYLPQDIQNQNALLLCHPEDLRYLKMVYETIVKEGSMAKSSPYRMLAQNGDYVKLQTEWSSFTNPWSNKLEFVVGKYYILEGPTTPDVFMSPQLKDTSEYSIAIAERADLYMENILKVLNNILKNPEENKLKLDEQPKVDAPNPGPNTDEDSVMLGALSPHSDCMNSVGTPMSYNQLNYKDNLQRYFDSHQPYCYDENISLVDVDAATAPDPKQLAKAASNSLVCPTALCSGEPVEKNCPSSPSALDLQPRNPLHNKFYKTRLTETLLTKHDTEMQKKFARNHRDCRYVNKSENASDSRQKTMEHLARCNASFQPTATAEATRLQGYKRASKEIEEGIAQKRSCLQPTSMVSCREISAFITAAPVQPTTTVDVFPRNHPLAGGPTTPMDSYWPDAESGNIPQTHQMPPPRSQQIQPFQDVFPMNHGGSTTPMDSYWPDAESGNIPQTHQMPPPLSQQMQPFKEVLPMNYPSAGVVSTTPMDSYWPDVESGNIPKTHQMPPPRSQQMQPLQDVFPMNNPLAGVSTTPMDSYWPDAESGNIPQTHQMPPPLSQQMQPLQDVFPMDHPSAGVSTTPMDSYWPDAESGNIPQTHQMPPPLSQQMQPFQKVLPMNYPSACIASTNRMDSSYWPDAESRNIPQTQQLPPPLPHEMQSFPSDPISLPYSLPEHSNSYYYNEKKAFDANNGPLEQLQPLNPSEFATTSYLQITKRKPEPKDYKTTQQKSSGPLVRSGTSRSNSDGTARTDGEYSSSSYYSPYLNLKSSSTGNSIDPNKSQPENAKKQKKSSPLVRTGTSRSNSDETVRTDGEYSCSSYYSSLFNTECSSTGNSIEPKKPRPDIIQKVAEWIPELPKAYKTSQQKTSGPLARSGTSRSNSDGTARTDGEYSSSSYYSPYLNLKSSSTGNSIDPNKSQPENAKKNSVAASAASPASHPYYYILENSQKSLCKKSSHPWSELAKMNTELAFRYQSQSRSKQEILKADESFANREQPPMVKEQLRQMFLELQLTPRLTLDDSSSSEESIFSVPKRPKSYRKQSKSKLQMIYEEDAPMLSPCTDLGASSRESSKSPLADLEASSGEPSKSPIITGLKASSDEPSKPIDLKANSGETPISPPADLEPSLGERLKPSPTDLEASSGKPSKPSPTDLETSSGEPLKSPTADSEASSGERPMPSIPNLEASSRQKDI